jgi:hypothetical protein
MNTTVKGGGDNDSSSNIPSTHLDNASSDASELMEECLSEYTAALDAAKVNLNKLRMR